MKPLGRLLITPFLLLLLVSFLLLAHLLEWTHPHPEPRTAS